MVLRPTDAEGVKLFVEPHVQSLAQAWEQRAVDERPRTERRHGTRRHHHHLHLRLHPVH